MRQLIYDQQLRTPGNRAVQIKLRRHSRPGVFALSGCSQYFQSVRKPQSLRRRICSDTAHCHIDSLFLCGPRRHKHCAGLARSVSITEKNLQISFCMFHIRFLLLVPLFSILTHCCQKSTVPLYLYINSTIRKIKKELNMPSLH